MRPDVSQQIIVEMVTTRTPVNVFIDRFKELGLIEEDHGGLLVTPALPHVVDQPRAVVSNGTSDSFVRRYGLRRGYQALSEGGP
jgi:hypothetical protein